MHATVRRYMLVATNNHALHSHTPNISLTLLLLVSLSLYLRRKGLIGLLGFVGSGSRETVENTRSGNRPSSSCSASSNGLPWSGVVSFRYWSSSLPLSVMAPVVFVVHTVNHFFPLEGIQCNKSYSPLSRPSIHSLIMLK